MSNWQIQDNKFDMSLTHSIAAPRETVYEVLANLETYPDFISDLVSVKREGDIYRFVARAAILTIPATVKVTKNPGESITFELLEGPVDRLTGRWLIEQGDSPGQTTVTLHVHAETDERGEWLLRMTGKYVQNKTGKLIKAFTTRVAQVQHGAVPAPEVTAGGGFIGWLKRPWTRLFGRESTPEAVEQAIDESAAVVPARPVPAFFREEHNIQTLEALAGTMLPADDFDSGGRELGFISVAEMRARYEGGREELYSTALAAVDHMARTMFDKLNFVSLSQEERTKLLDELRQGQANGEVWGPIEPDAFFSALWEDVVFLYCTHPDTWQRIGFPGPSFDAGGYKDYDSPQEFMGEKHDAN